MKFARLNGLLLLAFLAVPAKAAKAAVVYYNAVIDLTTPDPAATFGTRYVLPGDNVTVNSSDTIVGLITFANDKAVRLLNNSSSTFPGQEGTQVQFAMSGGSASSDITFRYVGLAGDYIGPVLQRSSGGGGGFTSAIFTNLTDTSFDFTGIEFTATMRAQPPNSFDPRFLWFNLGDIQIVDAPVPEPSTWAMMIAGFGLVGGAMRRRGREAALA